MSSTPHTERCPLCSAFETRSFATVHDRAYLRCAECRLTFMAPNHRLGSARERTRYATHENDPSDPDYRAFLGRLAGPLLEYLPTRSQGLDYGSGPGPTLSVMLEEAGHRMQIWDPFFAPDPAALARRYDFVTCTETVEHFFRPGEEFARLDDLLRSPGWLGIMTGVLEDDGAFADWWYVRDPTHVAFYRPETLEWIAGHFGWTLHRPAATVAIFCKE